jgi:hypothetical protein
MQMKITPPQAKSKSTVLECHILSHTSLNGAEHSIYDKTTWFH